MSSDDFCYFGDLEKRDIAVVVIALPIVAGAIKLLDAIVASLF